MKKGQGSNLTGKLLTKDSIRQAIYLNICNRPGELNGRIEVVLIIMA